jgi:GT2 family glycosyltransferase
MPLGADDHDYCLRVKQAGYKIMVAYSAFVSHKSHSSYRRARDTWDEWGGKSWEAFNKKWAGYFFNEEEAKRAHWQSEYTEGWETGTGRLSPEERAEVWSRREISNAV